MATTFYTMPAHDRLDASSVSSDTAGMRNALNQNMNSSWDITSADLPNWGYVIDTYPGAFSSETFTPTSGSYDAVGIWFKNYLPQNGVSFATSNIGVIESDAVGMSSPTTIGSYQAMTGFDGPLFVKSITASSQRFIKIEGTSFLHTPQIAGIFLLNTNTITRQHEYRGSTKLPMYDNDQVKSPGLNTFVQAHQLNNVDVYKRMYKLINATEVAWVNTVFTESRGTRQLFIYTEGTGQADNKLCRFKKDIPKWKDPTGDYREATLEFQSINYVQDGETL